MHGGTTWMRFSTTKLSSPRAVSAAFISCITGAGIGVFFCTSLTNSSAQNRPTPRASPIIG